MTHPALVTNAVRAASTETNADDVCRGVVETLGDADELLAAHLLDELVEVHGGDELLVANLGAIGEADDLLVGVDLGDLTLLSEALLLLGQRVGDGDPDTTGTVPGRETESGVRAPVTSSLVQDDVLGNELDVGGSYTLAEPVTSHLVVQLALIPDKTRGGIAVTYILGGDGPDLVVVGAHEDVGNVVTHLSHNPLVKVLGL